MWLVDDSDSGMIMVREPTTGLQVVAEALGTAHLQGSERRFHKHVIDSSSSPYLSDFQLFHRLGVDKS